MAPSESFRPFAKLSSGRTPAQALTAAEEVETDDPSRSRGCSLAALRRSALVADTGVELVHLPGAGKEEKRALLNARDIAALIRAREVLKRVEDAAWKESLSHFDPYASVSGWDLGRLSDAASMADDAIFHVLSTARHNCHVKITDAQLHAHAHEQEHESVRPAEAGPSEARPGSSPDVGPNGDRRGEGVARARGLPRDRAG